MPFVQSENPVIARPIAAALLDALSARPAAALLVTPFVHLATNGPVTLTPDWVPGDWTEATFTGYAAAALTLPLLGPLQIGQEQLGVHNVVNFLAGAVVPPGETIIGFWVDEAAAAGTDPYIAELFNTPIPIANPGDFVSLQVLAAIQEVLNLIF